MLSLSGGRISEILAFTPAAIDLDSGYCKPYYFETLQAGIVRQAPLPHNLLNELNRTFRLRRNQRDPDFSYRRIWSWSRTTAWRCVKEIMAAVKIVGLPAMPKGLHHGFGVRASRSNVPPHLVQRWLGHASMRRPLYGDVIGREERLFAARMWRR